MEPGWFPLITAIINVGFAVVVGAYLLTKAIPKMQDDHSKAIAEQRNAFIKEISSIRKESQEDSRNQRIEFKESLKVIADHCERENERRDKVLQIELSSLTRAMEAQSIIMEDLRDHLRATKKISS
jgi:hypothetical protein